MKIDSLNKVYLSKSEFPDAGRGVFARIPILAGELIEVCPVIEVPKKDPIIKATNSTIYKYLYSFGDGLGFAQGNGSLYNHSFNPNANYFKLPNRGTIEIVAVSQINPDDEITVNYHGDPTDQSPLDEIFGIK